MDFEFVFSELTALGLVEMEIKELLEVIEAALAVLEISSDVKV